MFRSSKLAALLVATASIAPLAIPVAASATATPNVQGNVLTVASDAADPIILSVVDVAGVRKIALNNVATTLTADANAEIVVNAGDQVDVVNASALAAGDYKSLEVNGGTGDDNITGGANADILNGDAGEDTLTGGKGNDTASGGTENDTMVWNNGDGTDVNNGEAGNDTVVSNGNDAAGETYTYGPRAEEGRVQFTRAPNAQGQGGFSINLEAESLVVNSLGGNDKLDPTAAGLAGRTVITVNAGAGDDTVTGGDGVDVQNGDAGNDTLVGGKGDDTANGGDGDDTMTWNNGDGTDVNTGGTGNDTVVSNGNDAAGETYTYGPRAEAGRVQFNRAPNAEGKGAFGINLEAEEFVINSLGGNDKFTPTAAGLAGRTLITVNAGEGDDTVTGGDGADDLHGDGGNDQLLARDGAADAVHGDAGEDRAQTDALSLDKVDGVEVVDALAEPDKKATLPLLGKAKVTKAGKKLFAQLPLSCPAAETGGCMVKITLKTAKPVRVGKVKKVVVLGSKSLNLAAGAKGMAKIALKPSAAALAKKGKLAAKALIVSTDAAGNKASKTATLSLKVPRVKK